MSTYCTVKDVRNALTPNGVESSSDRPETAAGLPDWQIEDAILEAEGTINSYVSARYLVTPYEIEIENTEQPGNIEVFLVAPSPLRGWTRDIAAYLAALTFRKNKDLTEDDPIRLRFAMVTSLLESVRDRKTDLSLPASQGDDQGVSVENLYEGHLFDMSDVGLGYEGRTVQYIEPSRRW